MGSYIMPVIVESEDTLKKQLSQQRSGRLKERLQVAYLVKSGQAQEAEHAGTLGGARSSHGDAVVRTLSGRGS